MKTLNCVILLILIVSCQNNPKKINTIKEGNYTGIFSYGNFTDNIIIEVERDSSNYQVFFTSLEQNANRIPLQQINVVGDSINFKLQSDYFTYTFKNKWVDNNEYLQGSLTVDTVTVNYSLEKELKNEQTLKSEDIVFKSNNLSINGTIWYPQNSNGNALVIVTSSGNADRSSSRAEAILFAQKGYTTFHYDKRGTGNSEGDWTSSTIEELSFDDVYAINYFSNKTHIPISKIGIKGSSQGASKVPFILNKLPEINYGIVVSCPGVTLLESDLNYWKNSNSNDIGNDIDEAFNLQGDVFKFIAGTFSKTDLEKLIKSKQDKVWFKNIWIPNLDEVKIDKKLLYSPIPYFEKVKQPILIVQGTKDDIIPIESSEIIAEALKKANNTTFEVHLLDGASHAMNYVDKSDFPYWSKLHSNYIETLEKWMSSKTK
jgi:uncharacterized protein